MRDIIYTFFPITSAARHSKRRRDYDALHPPPFILHVPPFDMLIVTHVALLRCCHAAMPCCYMLLCWRATLLMVARWRTARFALIDVAMPDKR